jgi:hypothetical protein
MYRTLVGFKTANCTKMLLAMVGERGRKCTEPWWGFRSPKREKMLLAMVGERERKCTEPWWGSKPQTDKKSCQTIDMYQSSYDQRF